MPQPRFRYLACVMLASTALSLSGCQTSGTTLQAQRGERLPLHSSGMSPTLAGNGGFALTLGAGDPAGWQIHDSRLALAEGRPSPETRLVVAPQDQ